MGRHRKAPRTLRVPDRTLLSVLSSPSAKGFTMSSRLFIDTPRLKCHEPVKVRAIELHLARHELAIQYFQCADCGDVEANFIYLSRSSCLNWQRRALLFQPAHRFSSF